MKPFIGRPVISAEQDATDRRKLIYRLTAKSIDLAPVLVELILWGARYEDTAAPPALLRKMERNRADFLSELRARWAADESSSVIPSGRGRWLFSSRVVQVFMSNGSCCRRQQCIES